MENGWVKIHRKIMDWEWYDDHDTTRLFIHLLLLASHEDRQWHGMTIKRGQVLTSLADLAQGTSLSVRKIRTSMTRLKSTSNLTSKTTNKFSLITICNYESYQDKKDASDKQNDKQNDNQTTSKRQTNTQELKKIQRIRKKEEKNINIFSSQKRKENNLLFDFSMILLTEGRANALKEAEAAIECNEADGWRHEVRKANGDTVVKDYSANRLSRLRGWKRSNPRTIPVMDATVWADALKRLSDEGFDVAAEAPGVINEFEGFDLQEDGSMVRVNFASNSAWRPLLAAIKTNTRLKEVIYAALREAYPRLEQACFYSKAPY